MCSIHKDDKYDYNIEMRYFNIKQFPRYNNYIAILKYSPALSVYLTNLHNK